MVCWASVRKHKARYSHTSTKRWPSRFTNVQCTLNLCSAFSYTTTAKIAINIRVAQSLASLCYQIQYMPSYFLGFRDMNSSRAGSTTAFPSGLNIAATWDPEMAGLWGAAMGVCTCNSAAAVLQKLCSASAFILAVTRRNLPGKERMCNLAPVFASPAFLKTVEILSIYLAKTHSWAIL